MAKKKSNSVSSKVFGQEMAFLAANYADDKKAEDIVIMDMRGISPVTDYYVVCTASSLPHLRAVRTEIRDRFWVEHDIKPVAADEKMESLWIILHYGDVMMHVFHKDKRDFYALEELWGDAPRVPWSPAVPEVTEKKAAPAKKAPAAKKVATKKVATKKTATKTAKKVAGKTK